MAVCSEGSAVCALPASKSQQVSRSLQRPGGFAAQVLQSACSAMDCSASCHVTSQDKPAAPLPAANGLTDDASDVGRCHPCLWRPSSGMGASVIAAAPCKSLISCQTWLSPVQTVCASCMPLLACSLPAKTAGTLHKEHVYPLCRHWPSSAQTLCAKGIYGPQSSHSIKVKVWQEAACMLRHGPAHCAGKEDDQFARLLHAKAGRELLCRYSSQGRCMDAEPPLLGGCNQDRAAAGGRQ